MACWRVVTSAMPWRSRRRPNARHRARGRIRSRCRSRSRISCAGTPSDGEVGAGVTQVITNNLKRSGLFAPIDPGCLHRTDLQHRYGAAIPELEDHQRPGAGDRSHDPAGRRPPEGRIPALGRGHRPAADRPAIFHVAGILAADRAHHFRPDLRAPDRREGLFRQPRGVRRRNRTRAAAHQAAGADGSGRRQCSLSDARHRPRADAAVLAVDPGNHLYGVRPGRPAGLPVQYRDRAARDRRQFSRHVVLATVLAGWPARRS